MTAKRIAYHTTDEVNLDAAMHTVQECGASLGRLPYPDKLSGGSFAGELSDLDHLDRGRGQETVSELVARPAPCPAAVHGYNLGEEQMTVLYANGVIVSRKFDPEVVRSLCRASRFSPSATPDPENRDSQGALDDPAVLCGNVRALATHAYQALRRTSDGMCDGLLLEIGEVRERIDQLQQQIVRLRRQHDLGLEDLQRWLDSLRRRVEGFLAQPPYDAEE